MCWLSPHFILSFFIMPFSMSTLKMNIFAFVDPILASSHYLLFPLYTALQQEPIIESFQIFRAVGSMPCRFIFNFGDIWEAYIIYLGLSGLLLSAISSHGIDHNQYISCISVLEKKRQCYKCKCEIVLYIF